MVTKLQDLGVQIVMENHEVNPLFENSIFFIPEKEVIRTEMVIHRQDVIVDRVTRALQV